MLERHTRHASAPREAEAAEAIHLHGQIANVEVAEADRVDQLTGLKEQNLVLEEEKHALENKLSCDELSSNELSIKASSLEVERDRLVGQVSLLEGTYSGLRDDVIGYKPFKEQIEAVQDEHVKVLSDKVAELDAKLMRMALHLNEEFYPRYLTTIGGRRWILSRGLRLVVMKCLQSPEYLAALGGAIGRAIDKGMQGGLAADIDHGKDGRGLADVAAYDPSAEANYISTVSALRAVDFLLLAQFESHKDTSMSDLMDLLPAEASTSRVPAPATTTALSTTFIQTSSVPPIPVADDRVLGMKKPTGVLSPSRIVFEKEELKTTPEHTTTS
ncbi:hypothetical protein Tco_0970422 [Tanacetum coccineum]